jgi:transposase InsO family protein
LSDLTVDPETVNDETAVVTRPDATDVTNWPIHMFVFLRTGVIPADLPQKYASVLKRQKSKFAVREGKLLRKIVINGQALAVPYLPKRFRKEKMIELHTVMGHLKSPSTFSSLQLRYWWPTIERDYKDLLSQCETCQLYNSGNSSIRHAMHPLPDPGLPFHSWHLDWIQDLPETSGGYSQVAVAVDKTTRFCFAYPFKSRTALDSATFLHMISLRFGSPYVVTTDRASAFLSNEFRIYCERNGIEHRKSTAYHPQTNGLVERVNGVLEKILVKMCAGSETIWDRFLEPAVFNLNARKHSVTGFSPFFLAHGCHPRLPGDVTPPVLFDFSQEGDRLSYTTRELTLLGHSRAAAFLRTQKQARTMATRHDASPHVQDKQFDLGEFVKRRSKRLPTQMKSKFAPVWEGPFIIDSVGPHDSYRLKRPDGTLEPHPVNGNHLAPFVTVRRDGVGS